MRLVALPTQAWTALRVVERKLDGTTLRLTLEGGGAAPPAPGEHIMLRAPYQGGATATATGSAIAELVALQRRRGGRSFGGRRRCVDPRPRDPFRRIQIGEAQGVVTVEANAAWDPSAHGARRIRVIRDARQMRSLSFDSA